MTDPHSPSVARRLAVQLADTEPYRSALARWDVLRVSRIAAGGSDAVAEAVAIAVELEESLNLPRP